MALPLPGTSAQRKEWAAQARQVAVHPVSVALGTLVAAAVGRKVFVRYLRRYPDVESLPGELGGLRLRGLVTSVGDADNFRFYHLPLLHRARGVPSGRTALKNQTLHVRLAGVDAPELAHFGNPAQPYGAEAMDWLTKRVNGKKVTVELWSKDRYGRVVGMAYDRPFPWIFRRNISREMLRAGWATVYLQAGAVHAGKLKEFEAVELAAKSRRRGMWEKGDGGETPAEYKRRTRGEEG